jgi:hypothetical protein
MRVIFCQAGNRRICPSVDPKEGLHRRDHRTNDSFAIVDRVHDFRYAVSFRLRSEGGDQECYRHGPDDRDNNHKRSPGTCRRMDICVVCSGRFAKKEKIVEEPYQGTEYDSSKSRNDSNQYR